MTKKLERENIKNMFDCKCAYCGKTLENKFHVDHVKDIYRGWEKKPDTHGKDELDNLFPSCPRCNLWKKTFTVEQFREEISMQIERLRLRSAGFRMAEDYGLLEPIQTPVLFWFEKYNSEG